MSPAEMFLDIFSGFDDCNFVLFDFAFLVWLVVFSLVVSVVVSF